MTRKRIFIADDHDILREGIKSILQEHPEYEITGEAADGETMLEMVRSLQPDILLLDITMPRRSGLDALEQVSRFSPQTKVIVITMHRSSSYMEKAMLSGVSGYLSKENVVKDLLPALACVSRGGVYTSPSLPARCLGQTGPTEDDIDTDGLRRLTPREKDILRLVAGGKTAKEIAEILFLSHRTVENYKNALLKKLNLHRTSDLIKYAIKNKIVDIEG